jgi:hypothetical protein
MRATGAWCWYSRGHGPLLRDVAGMARSYGVSRAWPAPTDRGDLRVCPA